MQASGYAESTPKREYLAQLFLEHGSLTKRSGYFLSYAFKDEVACNACLKKLNEELAVSELDFTFSKKHLRGRYFAYIKKTENVADFLYLLGAGKLADEIHNDNAVAITSSYHNRIANFDAANIKKSVSASVAQQQSCKWFLETTEKNEKTKELRQTAKARIDNKEATLQELANILNISKSCLNHRLRKIAGLFGNMARID